MSIVSNPSKKNKGMEPKQETAAAVKLSSKNLDEVMEILKKSGEPIDHPSKNLDEVTEILKKSGEPISLDHFLPPQKQEILRALDQADFKRATGQANPENTDNQKYR